MQLEVVEGHGHVTVRARGLLSLRTAPSLLQCLLKVAAEQPRGIVCDVSGVRATREGLTILYVVADRVANWPSTPLVLVTADPVLLGLLERLGLHRRLPVVPDLRQASTALRRSPTLLRAATRFPPTVDTPAAARAFVGAALKRWGADALALQALCVVSELATNAVVHAGTEVTVRVSLAGQRVSLAVADRGAGGAVGLGPHEGRGLRIVQELSGSWGSLSRLDGGTVVWAVLGTVGSRPLRVPHQTERE